MLFPNNGKCKTTSSFDFVPFFILKAETIIRFPGSTEAQYNSLSRINHINSPPLKREAVNYTH